jgi:hypothetical protein
MTLIRNNEKSYLHILRYLFEQGDEEKIKKYINEFSEDDPDYDVFIQKIKDLTKDDNLNVVEEMIYDEKLIDYNVVRTDDEFDEEEYEQYLYSGEHTYNDPLENIPNEDENLMNILEDGIEKIGDEFGNDDLGDLDLLK